MQNKYFFQMEVKEVKAEDNGGDVIIEGFASTPDLDRYRDIVEPKAFQDALELYMKNPVILYQHNADRPVGLATATKISGKGFWIRASIKEADTKEKVLNGLMRAFSIGYIPLESALEHEDGTAFNAEKDSYWDATLVRVIKKLDLVEISIVSTPANGNALFSVAKSVKRVFADLATKAFSMKTKSNDQDMNEVDADVAKPPVKADEEEKEESTEGEAAPAPEAKPAVKPESEDTEEEAKDESEADDTKKPTNGQKPPEADEKGDEKAPADSGEAPKGEEPKAESKPADEAEGEKSFEVSQLVAKALPELVQSGVLVEAKEAGKGADLPKQIVGLLRKLVDEVATQADRADGLQEKLNNIPAKSVLAPVGQYEDVPSAKAPAQKAVSAGFMDLIKNAS